MKTGLLWYDADPKRSVMKKIDEAAERYLEKFGRAPNTCYVNPNDVVSHPTLKVVAKPIVQLNHFLVGIDEESAGISLLGNSTAEANTRRAPRRKTKAVACEAQPEKKEKRLRLVRVKG